MPDEIVDQPPPVATDRVPAWELVGRDVAHLYGLSDRAGDRGAQTVVELMANDMRERDRIGRERYGVPLTSHNGRDCLVDAYQEALDACVYLRAALEEEMDQELLVRVRQRYWHMLAECVGLRGIIAQRGKS